MPAPSAVKQLNSTHLRQMGFICHGFVPRKHGCKKDELALWSARERLVKADLHPGENPSPRLEHTGYKCGLRVSYCVDPPNICWNKGDKRTGSLSLLAQGQ